MDSTETGMGAIRMPNNLPNLVKTRFNSALNSGDITYYPTQVAILRVNSIPFQLRFSPALANKPKGPPQEHNSSKPYNPFESPSRAFVVAPLPPSHVLILNKFAIVPGHFILATSSFKPQTHLLEEEDLAAALSCINAYSANDRQPGASALFAFFNSGEHSGASQPHRHLQLLPVEGMRAGLEDAGGSWEVLAPSLLDVKTRDALPFRTFAERIERHATPQNLRETYLALYRAACTAAGAPVHDDAGDVEAKISYNLAMTNQAMVLCPRMAEGAAISGPDGEDAGVLALNGTVLAGTALVKNQAEWDALRGEPEKLREVLGKIGLPNDH